MWSSIMECMAEVEPKSILEVGSNIGNNLHAINNISNAKLYAVEPIKQAREILVNSGLLPSENIFDGTAEKIPFSNQSADLVFTNGVLIHIHPNNLLQACKEIYRVSAKYIVCIEYFSDKNEEIPYRGHDEVLFKCDFGSFWLDNFSDLLLSGYGFNWKRATGLDNLNWWVFRKP